MDHETLDNSQPSPLSSRDVDHHLEDMNPHITNHEEAEPKSIISSEEIRSMMEVIAATGKFWHDWDMLKNLLSFWLKQVLADYPEAQPVSGDGPQQSSLSGETFQELVSRLDEALLSFIEGPPFTLQRLCEILLSPKSTYTTLSKLALALEKNLLVTSTLTVCTDPYPRLPSPKQPEPDQATESSPAPSTLVSNGVDAVPGDGDEEMVEAEAGEDAPNADTEANAHGAETEGPNTRNTDAEVDAPVAETEEPEPQNTDTEMQEGNVSEALEGSSSSSGSPVPSLEPGPVSEPITTSEEQSIKEENTTATQEA